MPHLIDPDWFKACEAHWGSVRAIDVFALAEQSQSVQGAFSMNVLGRALKGLPEQPWVRTLDQKPSSGAGVVWFECVGHQCKQNRLWLSLKVIAKVELICQRCMAPFLFDLDETVPFQLVRRASQVENEADDADPEAPERLLGSSRFDLMSLIEDQVILGLPYVPKHDVCPSGSHQVIDESSASVKKESPFHVLKGLKKG